MAGENELLEAEGINPNAPDIEIQEQDVVNRENTPDTTKTGNDSLDKRLEELATGTTRGNETLTLKEKPVQGRSTTDPALNKAQEQQKAPTVQPQHVSTGVGGYAGKAPRAYGPRFNWDAKGNVIDKATGNVIAAAGPERKAFERMIPLISNATNEADKFKNMYETAIKANTVASSLGLSAEEFSIGARIMAQWKTDPKKALAFMLKEAQNNGVDVSDLGIAGGGGLSRQELQNAIKDVVQEHLKPFSFIHEDRERQQQEREAINEAQGVIDEFYQEYPDASIHEDSLAAIMNAKPGTSLNEAYLILNNHALKHGLDWNRDLVPQIKALVSKQQPNGTNSNGQPARQQRQLPSMNGRVNSEAIVPHRNGAMSGDTSSSNIVKEAMRAAGMNVDGI